MWQNKMCLENEIRLPSPKKKKHVGKASLLMIVFVYKSILIKIYDLI